MAKYMHTLDGKPAFFNGQQICFLDHGFTLDDILCSSLREIRGQWLASIDFRRQHGWREDGRYGYLRFRDEQ